jgi:pyruvate dehydrogenase complex dehydrogenase (E1) component
LRWPPLEHVHGRDHGRLWFAELTDADRVSVKPHASPVLHAINYLLGDLVEPYLPTLRARAVKETTPRPCSVGHPRGSAV